MHEKVRKKNIVEAHLMSKIVANLKALFSGMDVAVPFVESALWNYNDVVQAGKIMVTICQKI